MNQTMISTGHSGLDIILDHLRLGDNVVWQTDNLQDYIDYVNMFVQKNIEDNKKIIYINFQNKESIINSKYDVKSYTIDPHQGFEDFSLRIRWIIEKEGKGTLYVFDSLTHLLEAWASDLMISNFFKVTSQYLTRLDCLSYFALKRNKHCHNTIAMVREAAQVILDLFNINDEIYIHPLKVHERSSPTMFLPHYRSGIDMLPLTSSIDTARLFSMLPDRTRDDARAHLDYWDKMFIKALDLLEAEGNDYINMQRDKLFKKILHMIIGKEGKILDLAEKYFDLGDLTTIGSRLVSSGYIGGKAVGMLLARKILRENGNKEWKKILEPHDSFYVGSDVFYSYIINNDLWDLYIEHRKKENYYDKAAILREKLKQGTFPKVIKEKFIRILQYYGQSPMIVRSSSLLEDGFGNAFAGKYESYFCVNQGTTKERYEKLERAIQDIYASTMSEGALTYRRKRKLDDRDEQMSLLIQRVSGDHHGKYFFPSLAGVGFSHNTYAWSPEMDPKAGFIRLVFGLGTRAVGRSEGDYPRIMALDYPNKQPLHGNDDKREFTQHSVDVLDMEKNDLVTVPLNKLMYEKTGVDMSYIGVLDYETNQKIKQIGIEGQEAWLLTYDKLISDTDFIDFMKDMLKTLEATYDYPVDLEFTLNFTSSKKIQINLLQCRPLQTKGMKNSHKIPSDIEADKIFFKSNGNFMGGNISQKIKRIIYIDPQNYIALPETKKYDIARTIGKLTNLNKDGDLPLLLMGPGRWGTSTISMGIPVSFSEINNVTVLCEESFSAGGMTPELSYGSHFFQDLVEDDIFYAAIFEDDKGVTFNKDFLKCQENLLSKLLPEAEKYKDVIHICDMDDVRIMSNVNTNEVVCYRE